MYRVSIKVESIPVVTRRAVDEATPELLIQAKARTPEGAMDKAMRILSGEITAIEESKTTAARGPVNIDDDEEVHLA